MGGLAIMPSHDVIRVEKLARNDVFAGLFFLGFVSAATDRVATSISVRGIADSITNTFDVSAIVWGACFFALSLARHCDGNRTRGVDWLVAGFALVGFLAPFSLLNWVALTCLASYVVLSSVPRSGLQRCAWIFVAVTFTMFWSPRIFALLSDWILAGDAELVSWITGTIRVGNTVQLSDGSGFLWIAPTCSSMANISLAVLCWTGFAQLSDRSVSTQDIIMCVLICFSVVVINVTRIGLIGLHPAWYQALHGPTGTIVFGYVTLFTIVGFCVLWKKRELFSPS